MCIRDRIYLVREAAPLHDLGKIAIPDSILLKPGRLTEEEFEVVKTHAVLGARVLAGGASALLRTAESIARHLGLDDRTVWLVRHAAPLHDLGKIAIPDSILLKPGRLSNAEFEVVKTHAEAGARVLAEGESELLEVAESIARSHHERWDGTGYPDALAGADIPLVGRLVHVADVFDVLVHERPYRESFTTAAATEEIARGAGTDFDPEIVAVFSRIGPE